MSPDNPSPDNPPLDNPPPDTIPQQIHIITYGNHNFSKARERVRKEALRTNWFSSITIYSPDDIDPSFSTQFQHILKQPRIAGYGIWRPYIIDKKLSEIEDNDILIYIDAGCTINARGKTRLDEYIQMLNTHDADTTTNNNLPILSFQMGFTEKHWTTQEIFDYFHISSEDPIANSGQYIDGILIMKKTPSIIQCINKWKQVIYDNPLLFTDHYNKKQASYFRNNRHEQSILSVLRKMYNTVVIPDETYFKPRWNSAKALSVPFWATRKRN